MMKNKQVTRIGALIIALIMVFSLAGCTRIGGAIDPGDWGFERKVIYHALGGRVNQREVRETYYMDGSLLLQPSGTQNMLVQPIKDGFVLAGWYTNAELISEATADAEAQYAFDPQDRWDFNIDRVEEDMTLYARWIPRGVVYYVDASNDKVMFSKNITEESPITELSYSALSLVQRSGYTMAGYYADKELTEPYDFTSYVHGELLPTESDVYAMLLDEFPDVLGVYEGEEVMPIVEDEEVVVVDESTDEDIDDGPETELIDPFAYIKRLGYIYLTDDEAAIAALRARRNEIYEENISYYVQNTANRVVYLRYDEGRSATISSLADLTYDGEIGFSGVDKSGKPISKYIIEADLDFAGKVITMASSFTGTIEGNGHTFSNVQINVRGRRRDVGIHMFGALFRTAKEVTISDLTFENFKIDVNVRSGNDITVAPIAIDAENLTIKNVTINGLEVTLGEGDDGKTPYIVHDFVASSVDSTFEDIAVNDLVVESEFAEVIKDYAK